MPRWRLVCLLAFLASACSGCGPRQVALSGEVTLDGKPVEAGSISFLPVSGQGRKAAAAILDGKYAVPLDRGPFPGSHRVEVSWHRSTGATEESSDPGLGRVAVVREAVPAKYNTNSELTVEITPGSNLHNFSLRSE